MTSRILCRWVLRASAIGAALLLFGCSSGKPYALVANLAINDPIQAASIEVSNGQCTVHVASLYYQNLYTPTCKINKNESNFKSFVIDGKEVNFGAVDNGFKVLGTIPHLPPTDLNMPAPAAGSGKAAAAAAPAAAPTAAPAATSATVAATAEAYPATWNVTPYPGHVKLSPQGLGFLATSAAMSINGGDLTLDVTFKGNYKALHMRGMVTANDHGDYHLIFNPRATSPLTGGGAFDIELTSEGQGIEGNTWDSHGFDSWTPTLPAQWSATSYSAE